MKWTQSPHSCINEIRAVVHRADKGSHRVLGPGESESSNEQVIKGRKYDWERSQTCIYFFHLSASHLYTANPSGVAQKHQDVQTSQFISQEPWVCHSQCFPFFPKSSDPPTGIWGREHSFQQLDTKSIGQIQYTKQLRDVWTPQLHWTHC